MEVPCSPEAGLAALETSTREDDCEASVMVAATAPCTTTPWPAVAPVAVMVAVTRVLPLPVFEA